MKVGYVRVSKLFPLIDKQVEILKDSGCTKIYCDDFSTSKQKTKLYDCLSSLHKDDYLIVQSFDRIASSIKELNIILSDLKERGVYFISLKEDYNTTLNQLGTMHKHVNILDSFMKVVMVDRITTGLEIAKSRGRLGGRRKAVSDELIMQIGDEYIMRSTTVQKPLLECYVKNLIGSDSTILIANKKYHILNFDKKEFSSQIIISGHKTKKTICITKNKSQYIVMMDDVEIDDKIVQVLNPPTQFEIMERYNIKRASFFRYIKEYKKIKNIGEQVFRGMKTEFICDTNDITVTELNKYKKLYEKYQKSSSLQNMSDCQEI